MKQTIQTSKCTAEIEIPMEKLVRKCKCYHLPPQTSGSSFYRTQPKQKIFMPFSGCCSNDQNTIEQSVTVEMLEELEREYRNDMRDHIQKNQQTQQRNTELTEEVARLRDQVKDLNAQLEVCQRNSAQTQRLKKQWEAQNAESKKEIDRIAKAKIYEFQNKYLMNQAEFNRRIAEVEQVSASKIQILSENYDAALRSLDTLNSENGYKIQQMDRENQLKIESLQNSHERQLQEFKKSLEQSYKELLEQQQITLKSTRSVYGKDLKDKQAQLKSMHEEREQMNQEIQQLSRREVDYQALSDQTKVYLDEIMIHKNTIQNLITQKAQCIQRYSELQHRFIALNQNFQGQEHYVRSLKNDNVNLHKEIDRLKQELLKKSEQLSEKEQPKNYEVVIQKLVNKQDYILQLETELEGLKRSQLELQELVATHERGIVVREQQVANINRQCEEYLTQIRELQLYIENKQKSFAWIVEKEILKDLKITEEEKRTVAYKVVPASQVKVPQ